MGAEKPELPGRLAGGDASDCGWTLSRGEGRSPFLRGGAREALGWKVQQRVRVRCQGWGAPQAQILTLPHTGHGLAHREGSDRLPECLSGFRSASPAYGGCSVAVVLIVDAVEKHDMQEAGHRGTMWNTQGGGQRGGAAGQRVTADGKPLARAGR